MNSNFNPDVGGGRGYSLAFTDKDMYASSQHYFTASNQWPIAAMTVSVWMRWVAISPTGIRSWAFSVIAANDPNHIQFGLNVVQPNPNPKGKGWLTNVETFTAQVTTFSPVIDLNSLSKCWTHITMTYNLTGM